jgi:deoxyribonuclease-1
VRNFFVFILIVFFSLYACGKPINDFEDKIIETHSQPVLDYLVARKYLFGQLHYQNGILIDVYCEQKWDKKHGVGKDKIPDQNFLNCEHTWPQSKFRNHPEELLIKSDLHHLYPVTKNSNSVRSNHPFGFISEGSIVCGNSKKGLIKNTKVIGFEPTDSHKGNVARAMFYISIRYKMPIDSYQETALRQWHKTDPVDSFEKSRNIAISKIQGNKNPFIENPELVNTISDF